ncbi:membrane protein [Serratia marcescens]|nr:membrane protein [Serratia marcescens]
MIAEKTVSILGVIFITAYMAKYIGPESFGKITFATAIFAITQTLALLGSDTILFKRISRNPRSGAALMFSTNRLRQACFLAFSAIILLYTGLREDFTTFYFCAATFLASFFSLKDVFAIYHDARLESRFNTLANVAGLASALLARWLIVFFDLHLYFLAIPIVMVYLIPYLIRHHLYHRRHPGFSAPAVFGANMCAICSPAACRWRYPMFPSPSIPGWRSCF